MSKLPEEIKTKWIEALRSGKYKQATGELFNGEGYCCLGVLVDIIDPEMFKNQYSDLYSACTLRSDESTFAKDHGLDALLEPNDELYEIALIDKPELADNEADNALMTLNDEAGFTFNQIADLIEKHL